MESLAAKGREGPARVLAGRPRMWGFLQPVWDAFQRLGSCRYLGPTNVGPIPWGAIDQYCVRHHITGAEYDYFVEMIESLDHTFLVETAPKDTKGVGRRGK